MMYRAIAALLAAMFTSVYAAAKMSNDDAHALARDIFEQLVEIKTTESGVGSTPAAEALAQLRGILETPPDPAVTCH